MCVHASCRSPISARYFSFQSSLAWIRRGNPRDCHRALHAKANVCSRVIVYRFMVRTNVYIYIICRDDLNIYHTQYMLFCVHIYVYCFLEHYAKIALGEKKNHRIRPRTICHEFQWVMNERNVSTRLRRMAAAAAAAVGKPKRATYIIQFNAFYSVGKKKLQRI